MNTVVVRLSSMADLKARFAEAIRRADSGDTAKATCSIEFATYEEMHRVLAPSRLAIVKALAGQGALSIREVARRVGRDVQAVHRDVTTLINAGVIDRTEEGVEFPYDRLHFEYDVSAAA
jgi:predicted transcriptional regulator